MEVRIYLNDWFYNMGIVGMIRILKYAKQKGENIEYQIEEDFLKVEDIVFNNFHEYYFDYFYDEYVKKDYKSLIEEFNYIKLTFKENELVQKIEDFLKNHKLVEKASKKGFENEAKEINDYIKRLKKNIDKYEIETLLSKIQNLINNRNVIEKYALDYTRSIMYDNFFGQMSFLQKSLSNESLDKHKQIMFKDFIKPVIVDIKVHQYIKNNDIVALDNFIKNENGKEENLKAYKRCFEKCKNDVNKFNESVYKNNYCSICNQYPSIKEDFNEQRFLILGVSNENTSNFFWNFITKYPICNICKLVMLCAPAGVVRFDKKYMENEDWWRRNFYTFVNLDTSLEDLFKKNELLKNKMNMDNPYKEFIMDFLEQVKEESIWTLQNILFVEFNGQYQGKKSNLKYMQINKSVAMYFKQYSNDTIGKIKDKKFKMELVDKILQNEDINHIIFAKLKYYLKKNFNGLDIYFSVVSKALLNCIKMKGDGIKVKEKVYWAFYEGQKMREFLKENKSENKINSLAYRLLNTAKVGNKKDFMDTILRLYINSELQVPKIFLESFYEELMDFETIAQSFIAGLITDKRDDKNEDEQGNITDLKEDENNE